MGKTQQQSAFGAKNSAHSSRLKLEYTGPHPVDFFGGATGRIYRFSAAQRVQPVDPRDAVFLLASRNFRLAQ